MDESSVEGWSVVGAAIALLRDIARGDVAVLRGERVTAEIAASPAPSLHAMGMVVASLPPSFRPHACRVHARALVRGSADPA
jgi:hypothetical protein